MQTVKSNIHMIKAF